MSTHGSITTKFATGCAWRAVYLYRGEPSLSSPPPLLYLGIDPTSGRGPRLFGGYHFTRRHQGRFSVTLPHLTWGLVWRLTELRAPRSRGAGTSARMRWAWAGAVMKGVCKTTPPKSSGSDSTPAASIDSAPSATPSSPPAPPTPS